jgi:flagellar hook-associated protein 3 FlgL
MRVTQSMLARMGMDQLSAQRARMARTQEMAATGLRINRPSDDPIDYRTVQSLKDSLAQTGRFIRSIDLTRPRFGAVENALSESALLVGQAKDKAIAVSSTTNFDQRSRDIFKAEIESIFDQLVSFGNSRGPGGEYIFSGVASDTASFTASGSFVSGSPPPTVTFNGDDTALEVEIDEGVYVAVTRGGATAFQGAGDVFAALGQLWSGLDTGIRIDIETAHGALQRAQDHFQLQQSVIGGAEAKANNFENRLHVQEDETISKISLLEDADAFEVYSDLVAQETALQASLNITSRLLQPTLLDFI